MLINDYGQRVAFSDRVQRVLTREALSCGKTAAAVDFENGTVERQARWVRVVEHVLADATRLFGTPHHRQLGGAHR